MPGTITTEAAGVDITVVALLGEHDLLTAGAVEETITAAVARGWNVVVDLTRTRFLDSAVIHALARVYQRPVAGDRRLVLQVTPEATVHRVLELTGLLTMLPWAASRERALELARGGK